MTSRKPLPSEAYPSQPQSNGNELLTIDFEKGEITKVNGQLYTTQTEAIRAIETLGNKYAIGRDIHVGDTIIGIKGRVGFEAAAPLMIIKAHHALEKHTLTKWQLYWKEQLANWYGMLLPEAQYLEPVMRDIEAFLENTQQNVTGTVYLRLNTYRFEVEGIESAHDLMKSGFEATMAR